MTIKVLVMSDRPDEYTGKKGLIKQQIITVLDLSETGERLAQPIEYAMSDEEKPVHAGKLQDKVITSEGRLQVVADLAGLGCYEINYAKTSSFADERFGQICGMPSGLQPGTQRLQFWIDHLHPDDRQLVLEERQKMYDGKVERYDVEYRYLHPAQGQKWLHHLAAVATRDITGRVVHVYGTVQDITERKQADEVLQRLRLQLWHADRVAQTGAITALHPPRAHLTQLGRYVLRAF